MKIERTKNATRNTLFGFLYKLAAMLFPFVIRTVMIYMMGMDYVGLSSLFTSILSFLSLAELGVGSALVFSMYKPIAEDDKDAICALLNLYRKLYFIIGTVIFVIGMILLPFLPYLIEGEYPADINLYVLYCIYLFNTVISYWMFGYKQSLLAAHQRSDIVSKRSLVIQTVMYICQIIVLCAARNYYMYIILLPIFTIITNLANAFIVDRMYPEYRCRGSVSKELSKSIQKKCLALFGTKANSVILHSLDTIVISAFLGLTMVSIYGNYYYIMNAIIGMLAIVYDSLTAGIGNSIVMDDSEKVYKDFNTLSFLNFWLICFCSTSLLCLYQPFMEIWVGKESMFQFDVVILLVVYFYFYVLQKIVLTYKDAAGIWWEDKIRPYVVMAVNLTGNLIMVQIIGIYGVILSTILSYIVSIPWQNYTVFKYLFHRSSRSYYLKTLIYTACAIAICAVTYLACYYCPNGVIGLFIRAFICAILPNVLFGLIFMKTEEFSAVIQKITSMLSSSGKIGNFRFGKNR